MRQHAADNFFTGEFNIHRVNRIDEVMSKEGIRTNYAEGFSARIRASVAERGTN